SGGGCLEVWVNVVCQPCKQREIGDNGQQAACHDDVLAPDPVRQPAKHDEEGRTDDKRNCDQNVRRLKIQLKADDEKEQRIELPRVPDHPLPGGRAKQREKHDLPVLPIREAFGERSFGSRAFTLDLLEHGRLFQVEPDVDGENQQEQRYEERDAPAPLSEVILGNVYSTEQDYDQRQEEAECSGRLDPARVVTASVLGSVLGHVGR